MKTTQSICAVIIILISSFGPVNADNSIVGSIKNVQGDAYVIRGGSDIAAKKGQKLYQSDVLQTDAGSSMGLILRDDTLISLGPNTQISIDEFKFIPAQNEFSIITKMFKGIVTYVSGKIAKLSPESARFETPVATVGVRGTKFLVKIDES